MQTGNRSLDHPLTYRLPEGMTAAPGSCVIAPLRGRPEIGYVLAVTQTPALPADLCIENRAPSSISDWKSISEVLETPSVFDRTTSSLFCWIARQYFCGMSDAIRCVIPPYRLVSVRTLVRLPAQPPRAASRRPSLLAEKVIEELRAAGGEAELQQLQQLIRTPRLTTAIRQLAQRGTVEVVRTAQEPSSGRALAGVRLAISADEARSWIVQHNSRREERQREALARVLEIGQPVGQAALAGALGCSVAPIKALVEKGLLERVPIPVRRSPWPPSPQIALGLSLNPEQVGALETILAAIARTARRSTAAHGSIDVPGAAEALVGAPAPEVALLRGVTGSGKTEVYLRAIEETIRLGKQAIALAPEISLTAQMVGIFQARFGSRVAVLHSKLSDGERLDEWERIRTGQVDVVIGARSALFAPTPRLGLVVLDEEHETSYKQDSSPRYLTRDTAIERARLAGACVVLASATPSLETAHLAEQGRARLARLPRRIDDRPLPSVILVDQRIELKENPGRIFSRRLESAIQQRLSRGEQTILFLNRRGWATITLCRECGYVARCRNCDVSLTFYASSRLLRCHHCEFTMAAPEICPKCGGAQIRQFGVGTEKVELEIGTLFPDARVARMDVDSVSRKGSLQDLINRFRRGQIDLLVGTQMVAKGFDFPGVTLVGVVSADTMLNLPDFRSAERTFQLLTQVSGRAGRGDQPGEVIVQTFNPEHYAIQAAAQHDFDEFYRQEIPRRRETRYPPFVRLASLVVEGRTRQETASRAERVREALGTGDNEVEILGPAPAPLSRIKGRFRWHLLLKSRDPSLLRAACRRLRLTLSAEDLRAVTVDLDPMSLL